MTVDTPRYAVYFTPDPRGALWRFGSAVIGYDASLGRDVPLMIPDGYGIASWAERTAEPRRYGFHATLRAPFHLVPERSEREFMAAVEQLASDLPAVGAIDLEITRLGGFVAAMITGDDSEVRDLAARIVMALEPFRAPLTAADRERRLRAPLSQRQRDLLESYGYPYVLEEFRFHMTLTDKLQAAEMEPVLSWLRAKFREASLGNGVPLDHISVLRQPRRDGRFAIIGRFPLST